MRGAYVIRSTPTQKAFEGRSIPFWALFNTLRNELGQSLIDDTKLEGLYDVKLVWTPERSLNTDTAADAVSIFTALQEQLGLKLEKSKGPVQVLVVDSVSKPSED